MKYVPDNTLAHYELMPQRQLINVSKVNCELFAQRISAYKDSHTLVKPEHEAIQFYLFNHLAKLLKDKFTANEPLPDWAKAVMQEYKSIVVNQGNRLTSYISLICARESRHMGAKNEEWWVENITKNFGAKCKDFHYLIKGKNSDVAAGRFLESAPDIPVGDFFKSLETIFFKGSFGSGYGGKPWGNIAKTLNQFLDGKISQEMMVDTAYTLAHNNGPMFNKGMMFNHYDSELLVILDVQRSGQIPEYVLEKCGVGLSPQQQTVFTNFKQALGNPFSSYVDWFKVERDGAVSSYGYQQQMQEKLHGKPAIPVKILDWNGKPAKQIGEFEITPIVSVPIIEREAA